jgi:ssDNA-specific exonuclease RecJ
MDSTRFNKILSILIEEILPQPIEEIKDIIQSEDFGNIFIIFNNGDEYYITINKFDREDYDDYLESLSTTD